MSDKIKRNIHFLLLLASTEASRHQKLKILDTISKDQLFCLSEIAWNCLQGSLDINASQKATLKRHLSKVRILASRKASIAQRKQVLTVPMIEVLLLTAHNFLKHVSSIVCET